MPGHGTEQGTASVAPVRLKPWRNALGLRRPLRDAWQASAQAGDRMTLQRLGASGAPTRVDLGAIRWLTTVLVALPVIGWTLRGVPPVDCRTSPLALRFGNESDATMTVASGQSCALALRNRSVQIESIAVDTPPRVGTLRARGQTGVTYLAASGFKGDDSFAIRLRGHDTAERGQMLVRVRVAVR